VKLAKDYMRHLPPGLCISLISFAAHADAVLIANVRIFDGVDERLTGENVSQTAGTAILVRFVRLGSPTCFFMKANCSRICLN